MTVECIICNKKFNNNKNLIPRSHRRIEKCLKITNDLYDIIFDYETNRIPFNELHYNEVKNKRELFMNFRLIDIEGHKY